jgi:hypothetical protein
VCVWQGMLVRPHLNQQARHGGSHLWFQLHRKPEVGESQSEAGPGQKHDIPSEK